MPPWLQDELTRFQKIENDLQAILAQKQHLEVERAETARTLEELKKTDDGETIFKIVGAAMLKTTKPKMTADLEERQALAETRLAVIQKQMARLTKSHKEQEAKINEMIRRGRATTSSSSSSTTTVPPPAHASRPPPP